MSKVTLQERNPAERLGRLALSSGHRLPAGVVVLLHLVGLAGISYAPTRPLMLALTPVHLVLVSLLLLSAHPDAKLKLALYVAAAAIISLLAEALGVAQGWLFGTYYYGNVLGPKVLEVPLLIGINWAVLGYCAGGMVRHLAQPMAAKVALGALLLVGFDACMEPAARGLGFWHWPGGYVPGQNFLGWWLTGLPVLWLRLKLLPPAHNPLAAVVWWCQFGFFFVLSWFVFADM